MAKNSELENAMRRYIDSPVDYCGVGRDKLRELLKNNSADTRYDVLMNVRGVQYSTWTSVLRAALVRGGGAWTGVHEAAYANDLESIRYILDGLPSVKKYDVVKIESYGSTPLHTAAY